MITLTAVVSNVLPAVGASLRSYELGLVDRARSGERQAFLGLYETHKRRVYSLSLRLLGDAGAAENLTSDIFIEAFRNLESITDESFADWLRRSALKNVMTGRVTAGRWRGTEACIHQGTSTETLAFVGKIDQTIPSECGCEG